MQHVHPYDEPVSGTPHGAATTVHNELTAKFQLSQKSHFLENRGKGLCPHTANAVPCSHHTQQHRTTPLVVSTALQACRSRGGNDSNVVLTHSKDPAASGGDTGVVLVRGIPPPRHTGRCLAAGHTTNTKATPVSRPSHRPNCAHPYGAHARLRSSSVKPNS